MKIIGHVTTEKVKSPEKADKNEDKDDEKTVLKVMTHISHPMNPGTKVEAKSGELRTMSLLTKIDVSFMPANSKDNTPQPLEIFGADLSSGLAANPFLSFYFQPPGPGEITCIWTGEKGQTWHASTKVK